MQLQLKLPTVFAQVALPLQFAAPDVHSLTSLQLTPLPLKPGLQAQLKLPGLLVQFALALQLLLPPGPHSLTSVQLTPLPL